MTRTLILIRHAKSGWDDPTLEDHERPLNARGQKSAAALGRWLAEKGHVPDEIRSSDSVRTAQTVAGIAEAMGQDVPRVSFVPRLYHAGPGTLMDEAINAVGETLALVAHNPGMAQFAEAMVRRAPDHPRFADYPTGATTVIRLGIDDWTHIVPGQGEVVDFTVPRDLIEAG